MENLELLRVSSLFVRAFCWLAKARAVVGQVRGLNPVLVEINRAGALGIGASSPGMVLPGSSSIGGRSRVLPFASRWAMSFSWSVACPVCSRRATTPAARRLPSAAQVCSWSSQL